MVQRLREWQTRGLRAIENLAGTSPAFEADVARLRERVDGTLDLDDFNVLSLVEKYDLPVGTVNCVEHYVATGKIDPALIESSIMIVNDHLQTIKPTNTPNQDARLKYFAYIELLKKQGYINLAIPADATQKEVVDFLKRNRVTLEESLAGISSRPRKRVRSKPKERRDRDVIRWVSEGHSTKEAARLANDKYPDDPTALTAADVRKIVSRKSSSP